MTSKASTVPQWVQQLQSPPAAKSKAPGIVDPPGFAGSGGNKPPTHDEMDTLKLKKAWEVALAPVKSLPMTLIMMYMSGNSLQIFSIMMVFMAFKNPIMGLANTNQAFERFQTETNSSKILQTKFVYVVMQLAALGVGIWKINGMGLLPTTRSDWLMWEAQREAVEHAIPAL
ncbi:putative membrane protein [Beauveria bassiana D1-5]|uniref:ER membrane protein complex subunit 4 n=1 Tax=Beauveria bassiana D1-5 TaxID=1245745 RepID=A0A0A2W5Q7_BEABA|nr:putative membrane protein [Beauveria bassiana D1-5]